MGGSGARIGKINAARDTTVCIHTRLCTVNIAIAPLHQISATAYSTVICIAAPIVCTIQTASYE